MSGRMRRFRRITFVILAAAVALSAPWIGPWPLLPLVVAAGGFVAFDRFTPRMHRPEYGLAAAWLLAQVMIAASVALSGGPHSPAVSWLAIPVASLGARFSRRGVVVGSVVTVAYALRKELRAFDLAYRVGGEEFLVVIPGGDEAEAGTLAERLRVAVEAEPAGGQPVTMSFGIASSGGGALDFDALFARADAALYEAKAAGRNAVRGGGELVSAG